MYWNEIIDIGQEVEETVDFETTSSFVFKRVFANKLSIKQQEHYNANKIGLRPEVAFEIRFEEYEGQNIVEWQEKRYYLVRTYDNQKNGTVELYLTSEIGVQNEYN